MDKIEIERGNLQTLFDIIIASLDFGSGFLDHEQIEILRHTAEQLGVNPMTATPSNCARLYPHEFEAYTFPGPGSTRIDAVGCKWCSISAKEHDWKDMPAS